MESDKEGVFNASIWMFPKIVVPPNQSKSSILIGLSIINHPFWGTPIFENTHLTGLLVQIFFYAKPHRSWIRIRTQRSRVYLGDWKSANKIGFGVFLKALFFWVGHFFKQKIHWYVAKAAQKRKKSRFFFAKKN